MSGNGKKETQQQENGSKKNEKMESKKGVLLIARNDPWFNYP